MIGWRSTPTNEATDQMVILVNFENHPVEVDIRFGLPGIWLRLASINLVNDIAPMGNNSIEDESALRLDDGTSYKYVLPDSSAFIYKWESGL